jgi:hypothetical protein
VELGYLFLVAAGWAAYGIYRMLRTGRESQRYLVESPREAPLQTEHLSPPLARLAHETRLLRVSLEAPVRHIRELLVGDLDSARNEDLEGFDNMLMNVSRQLGEWLRVVDELPATDAASLQDLGLSAEPVRSALIREGWTYDRKHLRGPGGTMDKRIAAVIAELLRFETMLQAQRRLYR